MKNTTFHFMERARVNFYFYMKQYIQCSEKVFVLIFFNIYHTSVFHIIKKMLILDKVLIFYDNVKRTCACSDRCALPMIHQIGVKRNFSSF